jgi:hypothetical protein
MQRDAGLCQARARGWTSGTRCDGAVIVHHIRPRGSGGSADPTIHDLDNLVVLCGGVTGRDGHHGEVHDHPSLSYECGLLARRA